jgi:hypothetical protein
MFLDKSDWTPIPDQLKIWYGDDWMTNTFSSIGFIVIEVSTEMSTTSNSEELSDVIKRDIEEWKEIRIKSKDE